MCWLRFLFAFSTILINIFLSSAPSVKKITIFKTISVFLLRLQSIFVKFTKMLVIVPNVRIRKLFPKLKKVVSLLDTSWIKQISFAARLSSDLYQNVLFVSMEGIGTKESAKSVILWYPRMDVCSVTLIISTLVSFACPITIWTITTTASDCLRLK